MHSRSGYTDSATAASTSCSMASPAPQACPWALPHGIACSVACCITSSIACSIMWLPQKATAKKRALIWQTRPVRYREPVHDIVRSRDIVLPPATTHFPVKCYAVQVQRNTGGSWDTHTQWACRHSKPPPFGPHHGVNLHGVNVKVLSVSDLLTPACSEPDTHRVATRETSDEPHPQVTDPPRESYPTTSTTVLVFLLRDLFFPCVPAPPEVSVPVCVTCLPLFPAMCLWLGSVVECDACVSVGRFGRGIRGL